MKFVQVDSIPEKKIYHPLQDMIREFADSDAKFVKVEISSRDYKSPLVCYSCLWNAVKTSGYRIKVTFRDGEVFLIKT